MRSWRPPLFRVITGVTVTTDLPRMSSNAAFTLGCLPSLIRLRVVGNGSLKRPLSPPSSASRGETQIESVESSPSWAPTCRRRGGKEEPGVEPLRHALGRDPVRVRNELVERQHHAVIGQHLEEADLAVAEVGTMRRLDLAGAFGIDQRLRYRSAVPAGCHSPRRSRGSQRCGNSASPHPAPRRPNTAPVSR